MLLTDGLYDVGEQYSIREVSLKVVDQTIIVTSFHQVVVRPVAVDLSHIQHTYELFT